MAWPKEKLEKIKQRNESIVASYIQGYSTTEIANKLNMSGHQISVIVRRAGVNRTLTEAWAVQKARQVPRKVRQRGVCSLPDCGKPLEGLGYCKLHYSHFKQHGDPLKGFIQNKGITQTPEYRTWIAIRRRCRNPKHKDYARYGAQGVIISDELHDNYQLFLQELGTRPTPQHSVDRIDGTKGYERGNIRWATKHEQAANRINVGQHVGINIKKGAVKKFHAEFSIGGKRVYSKTFYTYEEALAARLEQEEKYGIHYNDVYQKNS